ncbi:MAG: sialate O-acetylesterase [bacterium]
MNHNKYRWAAVGLVALMAWALAPAEALAGQAGKSPVKVFILAGQSNMEGQGAVKITPKSRNEGKGTLEYLVKDPATAERFKHTVDKKGDWVVRDDVWIWYLGRKGGLTAGYGANKNKIGPEFQFGHVIGQHVDNQVLLIKTAWGGKSLQKDFRPPSSGGEVGPFYTEMSGHVKQVLADLKKEFPDYDGKGYEIAGFGWHQGWNDGCTPAATAEYEKNMINFIRDVRKELGVKDLPFVIANSGFGGRDQKNERRLGIMKAQAGAAALPEFKGTVACVETRDFFRPAEASPSGQGYHWNGNAETYFLIGDAMGQAMLTLLKETKK